MSVAEDGFQQYLAEFAQNAREAYKAQSSGIPESGKSAQGEVSFNPDTGVLVVERKMSVPSADLEKVLLHSYHGNVQVVFTDDAEIQYVAQFECAGLDKTREAALQVLGENPCSLNVDSDGVATVAVEKSGSFGLEPSVNTITLAELPYDMRNMAQQALLGNGYNLGGGTYIRGQIIGDVVGGVGNNMTYQSSQGTLLINNDGVTFNGKKVVENRPITERAGEGFRATEQIMRVPRRLAASLLTRGGNITIVGNQEGFGAGVNSGKIEAKAIGGTVRLEGVDGRVIIGSQTKQVEVLGGKAVTLQLENEAGVPQQDVVAEGVAELTIDGTPESVELKNVDMFRATDISDSLDVTTVTTIDCGTISGRTTLTDVTRFTARRISGPLSATDVVSINCSTVSDTVALTRVGTFEASNVVSGKIGATTVDVIACGVITGRTTLTEVGRLSAREITGKLQATKVKTIELNEISDDVTLNGVGTFKANVTSGKIDATTVKMMKLGQASGRVTLNGVGTFEANVMNDRVKATDVSSFSCNLINDRADFTRTFGHIGIANDRVTQQNSSVAIRLNNG